MPARAHRLVSSGRLPNARPAACPPVGREERSLEKVQRYLEAAATDEDDLAADSTRERRAWLMRIWKRYFDDRNMDPDAIWVELCEGSREAAAWCKAFFSDYVEHSVRSVMVLGPAEYEDRRMVNSASTVVGMWRQLVKQADMTVMEEARRRQPRSAEKWRLRFHDHTARAPKTSITIYEVSIWIWYTLAKEAGLAREVTYDKVEATAEDSILLLRTLWERAPQLGIDSETRANFHGKLIEMGIGGFRPATILTLLYREVEFFVLRDPQDRTKLKYAVTLTIWRNKRKHSLSPRKDFRIKFSLFFVPVSLLCLGRLILARALQHDAFKAGFADEEDFFTRPVLGDVNCIPLEWKEDKLDQPIFRISYKQFNSIWHRVCMAAGFRTLPRLYAMRVGAAARLDENPLFSDALRNYVIDHSGPMYEAKYQTSRIRGDLLQAAFGSRTGSDNAHLFAVLRNISLSRDQNAPTDLAPEDWDEFEKREDATVLRGAIAEALERGETAFHATLRSRYKYLKRGWGQLKLAHNRTEYFKEADLCRARGQQPPRNAVQIPDEEVARRSRACNAPMADQLVQHFDRTWNRSTVVDGDDPARYVHLIRTYLERGSLATLDVWEEDEGADDASDQADLELGVEEDSCGRDGRQSQSGELDDSKGFSGRGSGSRETAGRGGSDVAGERDFRCVICQIPIETRRKLTNHYATHRRTELFDQPLRCADCPRGPDGRGTVVPAGYMAWVNHLARFHGERCTPFFQRAEDNPKMFPCPFLKCYVQTKRKLYSWRGLFPHLAFSHADERDPRVTSKFKESVPCHLCPPGGAENGAPLLILGAWEWRRHVEVDHEQGPSDPFQCLLCREPTRTSQGLMRHLTYLHERRENRFAGPFQCPECIRLGPVDAAWIVGKQAWIEHNSQSHAGGLRQSESGGSVSQLAQRPKRLRCLFCPKVYMTQSAWNKHVRHAHADIVERPSPCPECAGQGHEDAGPFQGIYTWSLHMARMHWADGPAKGPCIDIGGAGVAVPVTTQGSQRGNEPDRPNSLQRSQDSAASVDGSGGGPETWEGLEPWDVTSDEAWTSSSASDSGSDSDDLGAAYHERGCKRAKLSRDVEPRARSAGHVRSSATVDDSVIDPLLRGLDGAAGP